MDLGQWQRVDIPVIAGQDDLSLLRIAQPTLPATLDQHLQSVEVGAQELVEMGFRADIVPVWGPLFYTWCDETDQDPTEADALQRFVEREAIVDIRYSAYQGGPLEPIVELEQARSRGIAAVLANQVYPTEQTVADVWGRATALLRDLYANARMGTQLDVLCPSVGIEPIHWHLDGSTCRTAAASVDHVLVALLEALGSSGTAIVVDDGLPIHEVRVWSLGCGEVIPLPATEARTICQPEPGAQLLDAWGV